MVIKPDSYWLLSEDKHTGEEWCSSSTWQAFVFLLRRKRNNSTETCGGLKQENSVTLTTDGLLQSINRSEPSFNTSYITKTDEVLSRTAQHCRVLRLLIWFTEMLWVGHFVQIENGRSCSPQEELWWRFIWRHHQVNMWMCPIFNDHPPADLMTFTVANVSIKGVGLI